MKHSPQAFAIFILGAMLLSACSNGNLTGNLKSSFNSTDPWEEVRMGVNFIPYFSSEDSIAARMGNAVLDMTTESVQPETIEALLEGAGVQATRQILSADMLWSTVEPEDDEWNFEAADAVLKREDSPVEHMVTLFSLQFAWPTPPWVDSASEITLTCDLECEDYVSTVAERYAEDVTYWEIGNEMDKWSVASASAKPLGVETTFTPEQIASFVEEVSALIHVYDPKAVIVTPGLSSNDPAVEWLGEFLETLDPEAIDAIGYHSYYSWQRASAHRQEIQTVINTAGFQKKAVVLTEAGSSSNSGATAYTNYPNSLETQASDVFRIFIPALAAGDRQLIQHSYADAPEGQGGEFIDFGLMTVEGELKPVYYALQLFTEEILPVKTVAPVAVDSTQNVYRITLQDGSQCYVAWGTTEWSAPKNVSTYQSVYSTNGEWLETAVSYGDKIQLSSTPILVK